MELKDVSDICDSLIDEVSKAIVGKRSVLEKVVGILHEKMGLHRK